MAAAAEIGRNPVSKHRFQPEYGDEQADAGRDYRTRLARPNFQARTGTVKYLFFPVQLTTSRIGNLTRLIHTLAICDDHTYIHDTCCCCCCLHIKSRYGLYSVLSNIRTGPTDADAFRGHRLTTQKGYTYQKEIKGPRKVSTHAIIGK